MKKNAKIYVAGHTGLVGSALMRLLAAEGYKNLIAKTHKDLDLTDKKRVEAFFAGAKPDFVFLAAARVGGIQANNAYPAEFMYQNLMIQAHVIDLAYRYKVKKLIFLGSSCIYPKHCPQPMMEEFMLTGPIEPTNEPFAMAKLAGIKMCQAYNKQYKTHYIVAIPANVYGVCDHVDDSAHVVSALMKRFYDAKAKGEKEVVIWGSGKPRREFLYVDDLAAACLFLMRHYDSSEPINIGTGVETSIKELAGLIKRTAGYQGAIVYDMTKPDGNMRRFLDAKKIKKLGWKPSVGLKDGLQRTFTWFEKEVTAIRGC